MEHLDTKAFEGFKECCGCGWSFDPAEFDRHACSDMEYSKIHNHIESPCPNNCPVKLGSEKARRVRLKAQEQ